LCAEELDHGSFLAAELSGVQRDDVSFAPDDAVLAGNGKRIFLIRSSQQRRWLSSSISSAVVNPDLPSGLTAGAERRRTVFWQEF
jgi:hypothetical protein